MNFIDWKFIDWSAREPVQERKERGVLFKLRYLIMNIISYLSIYTLFQVVLLEFYRDKPILSQSKLL